MKLKNGDNVVEIPDRNFVLIGAVFKPASWAGGGYRLEEVERDRFEALDRKMAGAPAYCCAFPNCVTVWPPLDQDGEILIQYYPAAKEI